MYLRASDKATGVKNFHSAVGSKLMKGLTPPAGLEPLRFDYAASLAKPLVVGVLGFGRQGQRLVANVNPKFIKVQAIADVRPSNRKRAEEVAKDAHFHDTYEKLLAAAKADGLEAVVIALPSHLHAPAALAALEAGLHVFVEPPMALKVLDAKHLARKAAEKNLCLAVGQQRRYSRIYDQALKMIGANLLDDVHYLRSQWHVALPEKMTGKTATAGEARIDWWQDVPAEDAKLSVPGYGSPDELLHWQFYENYSGGLVAELGSQLFDVAALFVAAMPNHDPQRPYPLSVAGAGSQTLRQAQGDIDDHVHCIFEYAIQGYVVAKEVPPKARKKIALQFDMILGSDFDGYGEIVLGRQGSLVLEDEQRPMLFHTTDVDKSLRVVEKKNAKGVPAIAVPKDGKADEESEARGMQALHGADAGFAAELENWACCCKPGTRERVADGKSKSKLGSDAQAGVYTTVLTVAATNAVRLQTRVDFKDAWFDVKSDETPDGL